MKPAAENNVTVLVPTAARPDYLRTSLTSIRMQTARDRIAEVLVSENQDEAPTRQVLREFGDLPIRLVVRSPRLDRTRHLLALLREARSPLAALLMDDDWWSPCHLETALRCLKENPGSAGVVSASVFVKSESDGNPLYIHRSATVWMAAGRPPMLQPWRLERPQVLALCWLFTPFHCSTLVAPSGALARASELVETGDPNPYDVDRLLYVHLSRSGPLIFVPVPDSWIRWHQQNWVRTQDRRKLRLSHRASSERVEAIALAEGVAPRALWPKYLAPVPEEAEGEVYQRLMETLSPEEFYEAGYERHFSSAVLNSQLTALRNLAGTAKSILLG